MEAKNVVVTPAKTITVRRLPVVQTGVKAGQSKNRYGGPAT